jgi:crotonobetainyl-CoA:carnitine CoA-transferase CaiB-like acyl-CoA transferase
VYGALAVLAGIVQARSAGLGLHLELAQSDSAAAMDWLRSETFRAYERPESEVTGNATDNYERRPPGTGGMAESVRYQIYQSSDSHVLLQASEQKFWKNFCSAIGRDDLFERWPGQTYGDHARGNVELRRELRDIFRSRTSAEWIDLGGKANTPIAPVNTPETIADDPQFQDRLPWLSKELLGADQLPLPVKVVGGSLPTPTKAPTLGQHTDEVLCDILGLDEAALAGLRDSGAIR